MGSTCWLLPDVQNCADVGTYTWPYAVHHASLTNNQQLLPCPCSRRKSLTVLRVSCTHERRLLISCVVSPKRVIFFSATSTAFSISSTCSEGKSIYTRFHTKKVRTNASMHVPPIESKMPIGRLQCRILTSYIMLHLPRNTFALLLNLWLQSPALCATLAGILPSCEAC